MKTPKPIRTGVCLPDVKHAHHIDGLINKQAETHDLGDSNFDDAEGGKTDTSLTDDEVKQHVALVRSSCNDAPVPHCTTRGAATTDLLNLLSQAFDPAVQRAHDDD